MPLRHARYCGEAPIRLGPRFGRARRRNPRGPHATHGGYAALSSWLPLGLAALLLLLLPADAGRRATAPATNASTVIWQTTDSSSLSAPLVAPGGVPASTGGAPISPLFADTGLARPTPVAVADAPPPETADNTRLLAAAKQALPLLGGSTAAGWGTATAVGPVLQVKWEPGVTLADADAVQQAVVAAVGTVVDAMDRTFPSGFRSDQGTPL